jgi:hypothetical protein
MKYAAVLKANNEKIRLIKEKKLINGTPVSRAYTM